MSQAPDFIDRFPAASRPPSMPGLSLLMLVSAVAGVLLLWIEWQHWRDARPVVTAVLLATIVLLLIVWCALFALLQRHTRELADSEAWHRMLLANMSEGLVVVGADGLIRSVNASVLRMFGYRAEALIGQPADLLVPAPLGGEGSPRCSSGRPGHLHAPAETPQEAIGLRPDGSCFDVSCSRRTIEVGDAHYLVLLINDVTERKRINSELAQHASALETSNASLEQFAFVASHDMQEPLRMISSYLQLVQERYRDVLDEEGQSWIDYAVDGSHRMKALIDGLLQFSRVANRPLETESVSVAELMQNVRRELGGTIRECSAEIVETDLPQLQTDRNLLHHVLLNLLGNALKYRHPERPPFIEVRAVTSPERWLFTVADNGIGIDEQHLDRIFGLFKRLHSRRDYEGAGIGLAICRRIVERLGGTIWAESAPGEGTRLCFTLPRAETSLSVSDKDGAAVDE